MLHHHTQKLKLRVNDIAPPFATFERRVNDAFTFFLYEYVNPSMCIKTVKPRSLGISVG